MKKIETKRLLLRWLEIGDADFILKILNEPDYHKNIGDRGVRNIDDAKKYISEKVFNQYSTNGFGYFIVQLKDTKESIGMAGLMRRDWIEDVDIGFAFLKAYGGFGYATEAAKAVLEYARDDLKFKRIIGMTMPHNVPSQRVLEKLGLKFEKMVKFPDATVEDKLYSLDF